MIRLTVFLICLAGYASAEVLVATRTIPARSIIGPEDLAFQDINIMGGVSDPSIAVGQEARVALYAGRPIRAADLSPPAVVERNQLIPLIYSRGGITISTEGRALDRASPGDWIRVMNLNSRATITAQIQENGVAVVGQ
ncbi:flagellar basal body P-ring formation chaperone FlgA [Pseudooctadecabacter jejudonensis]|uniref:Flagella basal body P-ring formation protein FlgA n=1 Tax=Pseudooctadecabacter jejudonensis TaxID=1391910 RepID=A0A1Y5S3N3_9RHOB|nr:flagellar basal body P-ring formation chaperone FlgA [Pseudooctadecabacter jejudonensis]SLN31977.1 flagellar basal body P-ring biosynthesis protein FlgA [Pseudooctadecabacter jejudonensis]